MDSGLSEYDRRLLNGMETLHPTVAEAFTDAEWATFKHPPNSIYFDGKYHTHIALVTATVRRNARYGVTWFPYYSLSPYHADYMIPDGLIVLAWAHDLEEANLPAVEVWEEIGTEGY